MTTLSDDLSTWRWLMRTYPPDGWDGAAAARAHHDGRVVALEGKLDAQDPAWRDDVDPRPRTPNPRKEPE